jgi:hypothetical protein
MWKPSKRPCVSKSELIPIYGLRRLGEERQDANNLYPLRPSDTSPKYDEPQSYLGEAGWRWAYFNFSNIRSASSYATL